MQNSETPTALKSGPKIQTFGKKTPEPGAYRLNLQEIADSPLNLNGSQSTFMQIYRKLLDAKCSKKPEMMMGDASFDTEQGKMTVNCESGDSSLVRLLCDCIELHINGVEPFYSRWFFYEKDYARDDAQFCYSFFVVFKQRIVYEEFCFFSNSPLALEKADDENFIWRADSFKRDAWEIYWYRKFYTETFNGQLMVLRPDEPILYHYERTLSDPLRSVMQVILVKSYRLLWIIATLLTAILLPSIKLYLEIFAALLFIDLLYRLWRTRKIG